MKKLLCLILAVLLCLSALTACTDEDKKPEAAQPAAAVSVETEGTAAETAPNEPEETVPETVSVQVEDAESEEE